MMGVIDGCEKGGCRGRHGSLCLLTREGEGLASLSNEDEALARDRGGRRRRGQGVDLEVR